MKKLGGIKQVGTLKLGPIEIPMTIYQQDGKVRVEYLYNKEGKPAVSIFDGKNAVKTTPWDTETIIPLTGEELVKIKEQAAVTGILANYEELNYSVRSILPHEKDPKLTVVLMLRDDQVSEMKVILDKKSMVSEIELERFAGKALQKSRIEYSEYRDFGGVNLAMKTEELIGNRVLTSSIINSVETGFDFDKSIFEKP